MSVSIQQEAKKGMDAVINRNPNKSRESISLII